MHKTTTRQYIQWLVIDYKYTNAQNDDAVFLINWIICLNALNDVALFAYELVLLFIWL